ncbi:MAG: MraY family glycosyltransferase [Candidatus Omnitrophota bacterium]
MSSPAVAAGIGFLFSVLFLLLIRPAARRWSFLTSKEVPSIGGISMGLALLMGLLLTGPFFSSLSREAMGLLIASAVMLVAGIFDDHKELSVAQKFWVQLFAAAILIAFGVRTNFFNVGEPLNLVISVLWIIGITNAMNLLDVMDGLAGGVALVILSGFCVLSCMSGDSLTLGFSCVLAGSVLGFWIFNVPPAQVYMGNSGSHFLGLVLAAISLTGRYATPDRAVALLTPVLVLGFPILDTLFLIWVRVRKGRSAFNKSEDHMALRFLKKGYSKRKTLVVMMGWTLFFVLTGMVLGRGSHPFAVLALVLAGLGSLFLIKDMERVKI